MSDKAPEDPSTPPPPPSAAVAAAALLSGGKGAKGPLSGLKAPTNTPLGSGANTPQATPNQKVRKSLESAGAVRVSSPLIKRPDEKDMLKQVQAKLDAIALDEDGEAEDGQVVAAVDADADEDDEIVDQEFGAEDSSEDEHDHERDLEAARAEMLASLSPKTRACLETMTELDKQADNIFSEYELERKALERKFLDKYAKVFEQRKDLVADGVPLNGEKLENEGDGDESARKGVPSFWLTAMSNHVVLASLLSEEDIEALNALVDIRVADVPEDDKFGYKLEFEFGPNRFFTNKVISKTYYIANFYHQGSYPVLDRAEATPIEWKSQDVNLAEKLVTKTSGGKSGRPERRRVVKQPKESFFNFFSTPWQDKEHGGRGDTMEEEEKYELASEDFEIAEVIRRKLVPKALGWFLAEEEDDEFEEEEDSDDDEGDEDDDDDYDEDSDEDEDDSEDDEDDVSDDDDDESDKPRKTPKGKKGKKGKGPQYNVVDGQEGGQPECKQQ
jgi:nucleosome assembly protein 1-like 1